MPIAIIYAAYIVAADITLATVANVYTQLRHPPKCECVIKSQPSGIDSTSAQK